VAGARQPDRKLKAAFFTSLLKDPNNGITDTDSAFTVLVFLTRGFAYDKKPASLEKRAFRFS